MRVDVHHTCSEFDSYRAARVKSLFNCESGANFTLAAELPIDDQDWRVGVIVGPSGSGKTSVGARLFGPRAIWRPRWPKDSPIIDAIAPGESFDTVPAALSAVGLGSVPAWLRPYHVLSNGERFRADLARLIAERPPRAVVDEFSSVVDRQIARIGAMAFAKAWRRGDGQAVLLSCHYDILDWIEPDWIFDTATGAFERAAAGRRLRRRPPITFELWQTDRHQWPAFEPHHRHAGEPLAARAGANGPATAGRRAGRRGGGPAGQAAAGRAAGDLGAGVRPARAAVRRPIAARGCIVTSDVIGWRHGRECPGRHPPAVSSRDTSRGERHARMPGV